MHNYHSTNFITGLRAIAILLVFIIHSRGAGLVEVGGPFKAFANLGKYGVEMFFVISGFTIFYQLEKNYLSYKKFLWNRMTRLSIPYFPLVILISLYITLIDPQFSYWLNKFSESKISLLNIISHLSYTGFLSEKYANTILGVEWSLNIEMFFYIIIGFLITRKLIKPNLHILSLHFVFWCLVAIVIIILVKTNNLRTTQAQWLPFKYGWMFILGGISYYARIHFQNIASVKTLHLASNIYLPIPFIIVICLSNLEALNQVGVINELIFSILTFGFIIFTNDKAISTKILINKPIIFLGSISYSFYLIHMPIIQLNLFSTSNTTINSILNLIVIIIIAKVWCVIFENIAYSKIKGIIR